VVCVIDYVCNCVKVAHLVSWSSGVILSQVSISSDMTYLSPVKSTSCLRKLSIITALMLSQDLLIVADVTLHVYPRQTKTKSSNIYTKKPTM